MAYLFVEELQVSRALILDVSDFIAVLIGPTRVAFPFLIFVILIIIACDAEVFLLLGFFSICDG